MLRQAAAKPGAAKPGAPAAGRPSSGRAPAASPQGGAVPGKGKGKGKRKAASSGSSSSSDSSSSSGSEQPLARKKKAAPKKAGAKKARKKATGGENGGEGDDEGFDGGGAVKKKERAPKEDVVAALLCRWWYALPDWPPTEQSFYDAKLKEKKLKRVTVQEWEWLPDSDSGGLTKVYELSQFKGVFRGPKGELHDLRPKDTCPCYKNLMTWDMHKLLDNLVKAIEKQQEELKKSKYNEAEVEKKLKAELTRYRSQLHKSQALKT